MYNIQVQTDTTIVRMTPDGQPRLVPDAVWLAFLEGRLPLPATRPGAVKVVHVRMARGRTPPLCLELEGAIYPVDSQGFLTSEDTPPLGRLAGGNVADGRYQFFLRRARHRHGWRPPPPVCDAVLRLVDEDRRQG